MQKLEIIYEDQEVLVCVKPAGVATQTKRMGQQDMESLLCNYRAQKGEEPYIGVVHRLDQPVEGVMVFAKNRHAAGKLNQQIAKRQADKCYLAICEDAQEELEVGKTYTLKDYLCKDGRTNTSRVVAREEKEAKRAELTYEVLARKEGLALVKVELETGRHHQIRVQFAHAGHPLWKDQKYGNSTDRYANVALCSVKIGFEHPRNKKKMEYEIRPTGKEFNLFSDTY